MCDTMSGPLERPLKAGKSLAIKCFSLQCLHFESCYMISFQFLYIMGALHMGLIILNNSVIMCFV